MSINDVSAAFNGWLQVLTGVRNTGSYVDGRWTPATSPLSFNGVIQNTVPDDLKVIEEGLRTSESIKIHTPFELVAQIADTTTGDLISYNGKDWLVHNVADRKIGGYYKAIAIRQ